MSAQNMGIPDFVYNELKQALKKRLHRIIRKLRHINYRTEDSYFIALFSALQTDEIFFGDGYYLDFYSAKMTDRGRNSAESKNGCDFSLLINWHDKTSVKLQKAIIGQAKNEPYNELSNTEKKRLYDQCDDMVAVTEHYIVTFRNDDDILPTVNLGTPQNGGFTNAKIPLDEYIIDKLLSCLHGETNIDKIQTMLNSKMEKEDSYLFFLNTNLPTPTLNKKTD
ncbi:TPA: hypothetical protein I8271_001353 [Kluyvera intermedia]|uniref:Uncharacterized protein n=2 Tax=Enterobacteriaceae TaxID=543 RepID=A0AAC8QT55_9ENTR|nr:MULTISPECIES: hypothetical protein [Enterobacteriaceae]HAT2204532.1 hypothetical protein [Kluyvera intermedia]AKL14508.1 hypothetical protein AB182_25985 [Phytobacter ursingii]HAT2515103.1 hypothetical protein [Kluyvera intermedia]HAT2602855.1 hypothetical protein [Kluyvera intermedia]HAT2680921.1 hypothetical protein [Kluyvera intermedia]